MIPVLFLGLLAMAGAQSGPLPPGTCGDFVMPGGRRASVSRLLGAPARVVAALPWTSEPYAVAFLAVPQPAPSPPERLVGLLQDDRLVFQQRIHLLPDEVAPFLARVSGGLALVRPSVGEIRAWDPEGQERFRVQLPEYPFQDEPTVLLATGDSLWYVAWAMEGEIRWAAYGPRGRLRQQGRLPGWPAHLVVFRGKPLLVRYWVEENRIRQFEVVDPETQRVLRKSPQHLNLWAVGARFLVLQEGKHWFLWNPPTEPEALPITGKLRVFRHPEGHFVVLLQGTWQFEGSERRPVFQLQTVYWLLPDGSLHEHRLTARLAEPLPVEFHGETFVVKSCSRFWRLP